VHLTGHGSQGSLWLYRSEIRVYAASQDGLPDKVQPWTVDPGNTFAAEIAHWLDCLDQALVADQDGSPSPISAREQRKPLLAVLAAYASMQRGERVALAEFERTHKSVPSGGTDDGTEW
jgi:predicted dehydrogenase